MYLLFCFPYYHPDGGWSDYKGMHETIWDARLAAEALPWWEVDMAQIVEANTYDYDDGRHGCESKVEGFEVVVTGRRVGHHEEARIEWDVAKTNIHKTREVCEWADDNEGTWLTKCGDAFQFYEGGPKDNQFQFCPYCGLPLEERKEG